MILRWEDETKFDCRSVARLLFRRRLHPPEIGQESETAGRESESGMHNENRVRTERGTERSLHANNNIASTTAEGARGPA